MLLEIAHRRCLRLAWLGASSLINFHNSLLLYRQKSSLPRNPAGGAAAAWSRQYRDRQRAPVLTGTEIRKAPKELPPANCTLPKLLPPGRLRVPPRRLRTPDQFKPVSPMLFTVDVGGGPAGPSGDGRYLLSRPGARSQPPRAQRAQSYLESVDEVGALASGHAVDDLFIYF